MKSNSASTIFVDKLAYGNEFVFMCLCLDKPHYEVRGKPKELTCRYCGRRYIFVYKEGVNNET